MATVVNKTTLQLRRSVNTPDFPEVDWWINPVIPNVEQRYWKAGPSGPLEMTAPEKAAADQASSDAHTQSNRDASVAAVDATTPGGVTNRALIEEFNRRDNYLTNRIIELQTIIQAMLASAGDAQAMRDAASALPISTTSTRSKAETVQSYKDEIQSGNQDG